MGVGDCVTVSREFELGSVIFCKVSPTLAVTATKKEGILLYSVTEFWCCAGT